MKKKTIILCLGLLFCNITFADDPTIETEWKIETRSISFLPVSIIATGNKVSIYYYGNVSDMFLCITDYSGNLIYSDVVSGMYGEHYEFPVMLQHEEVYNIQLIHKDVCLLGTIETK